MDKGEGVEPVQIFCGQRGGVNFSRFYMDVLYGRPLMPNVGCSKVVSSVKTNHQ